jgi:SSS family solute:Na+ symporter
MNVFKQLQVTWVFPILFAAVFWTGLFWRRATTTAAWMTIGFVTLAFFVLPYALPDMMDLRTKESLLSRNQIVETTTTRKAAPSDIARRKMEIAEWQREPGTGEAPTALQLGDTISEKKVTGGKAIFWSEGISATDTDGTPVKPLPVGDVEQVNERTTRQVLEYPDGTNFKGNGNLRLDYLLYKPVTDLTQYSSAMLDTLELPLKIVLPFALMIALSLVTKRNDKQVLDRHYAKMKTPVEPDVDLDQQNLERAFESYEPFEQRKLIPNSDFELERPSRMDVVGGFVTLAACCGVIVLALWVASIGKP